MRSERIRHDPLTRRVLGHQDASLMLSSPRCPAMVSRNGLPKPAFVSLGCGIASCADSDPSRDLERLSLLNGHQCRRRRQSRFLAGED